MEQAKRLKNIYLRIHNGYSLTMNDLIFLWEADRECFVKTYGHIVLNEQVKRVIDEPVELSEAPISVQPDEGRKRINLLISRLNVGQINSEVQRPARTAKVIELIGESEERLTPQARQYQYYSIAEPERLLNARV